MLFESPRPESWGIYKRKNEKSSWEPYQFYSATCRDTYELPESKETIRGDDTRVLCTSEFSDISPLTKGTVAFSTLEGRPSAYYFETHTELQAINNKRTIKNNVFLTHKIQRVLILFVKHNNIVRLLFELFC